MTHPRLIIVLLVSFLCLPAFADDKVIKLYDGKAPGSEDWKHSEQESTQNLWNTRVVFNVASPTLTVFQPDASKSNGTALIICPGGAFFGLSIDSEGNDVARWLNEKGVTCFVLKYRLVQCETDDPTRELMSRGKLDDVVAPVIKLALADGKAAVAHVRKHAKDYNINPDHIGIMGFSAGGTVAASVAFNYDADSKPNFVAPVYLAYTWTIKDKGVPVDAPPMFILAASDDQLGLASHSIDLYKDWTKAKKPAELHMFNKGGHGFGMKKQNIPTDRWIERFADWLEGQGLLKGANNNDLGSLQGKWLMLNPDGSGGTIPDSLRECKGDLTTVSFGGQLMMKSKFSLDPAKNPRTIDYDVIEGNNQGKKLLGIYELNGDTVRFCFALPGNDRPTDFAPGEGRIASAWKREPAK